MLTGPLSIGSGIGRKGSSAVFGFGWPAVCSGFGADSPFGAASAGVALAEEDSLPAGLRLAGVGTPVFGFAGARGRRLRGDVLRFRAEVGQLLDLDRFRCGRRVWLADVFGRTKCGSQHGQGRRREGKTPQVFAPHRAFLLEPRWANRGTPGVLNAGVYPFGPNRVQTEFYAFSEIWRKTGRIDVPVLQKAPAAAGFLARWAICATWE